MDLFSQSKRDLLDKKIAIIRNELPDIRLGIVGSRKRNGEKDEKIVVYVIKKLRPVEIVSGECKIGADAFAKKNAELMHITYQPFPPRFPPYRISYKEACNLLFDRNFEIAFYSNVLLALESPTKDGGTANTVMHWRDLGKEERYLLLM